MNGPQAAILGDRLHLQHGPIDLIIGADGDRALAFDAARARFETILQELMQEIDLLRQPIKAGIDPIGEIARLMCRAAARFDGFVTPMAGVAGAVSETVLKAMTDATPLARGYVNNGGDIAIHLAEGGAFKVAMAGPQGATLGMIEITHEDPVRGIATSGQQGRSMSMGIADSVTVLGENAALADVAATLIGNAVDLSGHPLIARSPANELSDWTDLGDRLVVTECGALGTHETRSALANGVRRAQEFEKQRTINAACLFLKGQVRATGQRHLFSGAETPEKQGHLENA